MLKKLEEEYYELQFQENYSSGQDFIVGDTFVKNTGSSRKLWLCLNLIKNAFKTLVSLFIIKLV